MSPPSKIGTEKSTEHSMQEGLFIQSVLYRFTSQWNANHYLVRLSYREESKLSRVVTGLKLQNKFLHSDLMVSNAFSKMI